MTEKIVVTSGGKFTDVDALACAVAYAELLRLQGKDATAVLLPQLNHTITTMVRGLNPAFETVPPVGEMAYALVDISDPAWVEPFVDLAKVSAVFDHHFGYETFWCERIGEAAHIEMIGAAATLIWEAWVQAGLEEKISPVSANLLAIAIVSNTLNFKADVTSDRDRDAFARLARHTTLPDGWVSLYLDEVEAEISAHLADLLPHDTKPVALPSFDQLVYVSQIEVRDGVDFLRNNKEHILAFMRREPSPYCFTDIPSMHDGRTYIVAEHEQVQRVLSETLNITFTDNMAVVYSCMLRKVILKELLREKGNDTTQQVV